MLPQHAPAPQSPRRIGVGIGIGIGTSRYGHFAVFVKEDLQPAADELTFAESAAGYALLHQRLQGILQRYGPLSFAFRLDVARPHADNLLHYLYQLATPRANKPDSSVPMALTISCGHLPPRAETIVAETIDLSAFRVPERSRSEYLGPWLESPTRNTGVIRGLSTNQCRV
jgi:hypothetical protein